MPEAIDWRRAQPAGFRWPDGVRAAACFTFDVDAESPILFDHPEAADWLDVMSHQAYGARTGIARLLRALDRRAVRATFFIPGYSAERWPAICRSIRDAGHEIAHHGYLHEGAHGASEAEQERRLVRGLEALDEVLGIRPTGYRAPNWEMTYETPAILARHGFVYDSGLMDDDHPYVLAVSEDREPRRLSSCRPTGRSTTGSPTTTCPGSPAPA
jgi:peptidoglycan/xylan/chitin deacetylase (PgdA/CDA1 family)